MGEQKQLLPVWEVSPMRIADDSEMKLCKSYRDALRMTIERAGRKRFAIEEESGISSSHLSQVLSGAKHMPSDERFVSFFSACRNIFALQWVAWHLGYRLVKRDLTAEEALRRENDELRRDLERRSA